MSMVSKNADLIVIASQVRTFNGAHDATAIAITDGRVSAVGTEAAVKWRRGPHTCVHRYPHATVLPGLTDCHTHLAEGLALSRGIELTDMTLEDVRNALGSAVRKSDSAAWIFGWGLDPNIFTPTGFTGRIFDDATPGNPIFLRMRDGHSAIVNSRAVQALELTGSETFDDESRIDTDEFGTPTGYVVELGAIARVTGAIPAEPFALVVARINDILTSMSRVGLTTTHVLDYSDEIGRVLASIESVADLPLRLRLSPWVTATMDELTWGAIARQQGVGGRRWIVEGVKFFIDGTIDNGTAWLHDPDTRGQGTRSIWSDPQRYRNALAFFAEQGIPTTTHAIGDKGVDFVLDCLESLGDARGRAPHRIEHIETIRDETVRRFAHLGVTASMQPIHGTHHTRADRSDNWSRRLGPERAARGWRCRDLLDAGATLALGTDWPITPFDPRKMIADTVLRRPVDRPDMAPIQPEQSLTLEEAFHGYTTGAARSVGLEGELGAISVGARADFTIFDSDPLSVNAQDLPQVGIMCTYIDGRRVLTEAIPADFIDYGRM